MKDFRVTVTVRNNLLLSAIEKAGYANQTKFAAAANISNQTLGTLINFKLSALNEDGDLRKIVVDICAFLNKIPEELFPEVSMYGELKSNSVDVQCTNEEIGALFIDGPEAIANKTQINQAVRKMINSLPKQYSAIMKLRYGIDGPEHTLEEIGKMFNVSAPWIRAVEMKSLRMMRHSSSRLNSGLTEALMN